MKVGINTSPLTSAHKNRGIGYYTYNLIEGLKKDPAVDVVEFNNISEVEDVDLVHYPWLDLFFSYLAH